MDSALQTPKTDNSTFSALKAELRKFEVYPFWRNLVGCSISCHLVALSVLEGAFLVWKGACIVSFPLQAQQRRLHQSLAELEDLNKQYRQLAREGRTDSAGELRQMVHRVNDQWDELAQRTAAIIRRLRHMTNVVDDFRATREGLLVWLADLESQMGTISRGYESRAEKMEKLKVWEAQIFRIC